MRGGEKGFYNSVVNQNYSIRYPFKAGVKGGQAVEHGWQKVCLLLQVLLLMFLIVMVVGTRPSGLCRTPEKGEACASLFVHGTRQKLIISTGPADSKMHARLLSSQERC
jgi:hypothetical protein